MCLNWSLDGSPNGHKTILNKRSNKSLAIQFPRKFIEFSFSQRFFAVLVRVTTKHSTRLVSTMFRIQIKLPTHRNCSTQKKTRRAFFVGGAKKRYFRTNRMIVIVTPCWKVNQPKISSWVWVLKTWFENFDGKLKITSMDLLMSWHDSVSMCKVN